MNKLDRFSQYKVTWGSQKHGVDYGNTGCGVFKRGIQD